MPAAWLLAVYRTPTSPSTARVAAWRGLHALGGLFIAPTVCVLPPAVGDARQLDAVAMRVRSAGGSFEVFEVEAFAEATELTMRARYSEARDAEYAEVVEQAEAMIAELDREGAHGKFTYAEVEENEADLAKLQRWLRRVRARDVFASAGRAAAVSGVERAATRLEAFVGEAIAREQRLAGEDADTTSESTPLLKIVRDRR